MRPRTCTPRAPPRREFALPSLLSARPRRLWVALGGARGKRGQSGAAAPAGSSGSARSAEGAGTERGSPGAAADGGREREDELIPAFLRRERV